MEELYLETKNGKVPIDPAVAEKLGLEKGTKSPFSRQRIVGPNGEYPQETGIEKDPKNQPLSKSGRAEDDDPLYGGTMLTTSEILDFAQGTDSTNGQ